MALPRAMTEADFEWWQQHCEQEAAQLTGIAEVQHRLAVAKKMLKMAQGHYREDSDQRHLQIARTAGIRIEVMAARLKRLREIT